ncbi:MAG TPA: hypothetical protein PKD64_06335 [Pirellulaceae bacterium]|nr:hypothetical protein [Pirellulaceae bacterium]HMO91799.1 hypothetical protein [Pirellulaceae bacterium]HMP69598.1 hypothetical protein [Pirellulaceae bacterium]
MSHQWWTHAVHKAGHAKGKDRKVGGCFLIIIGFFFAPLLFGIPIMIWGFVKLFSDGD